MAKSSKKSKLSKALEQFNAKNKKKTGAKTLKGILKATGQNKPQSSKYSAGRDASRKGKPGGWRFTNAGAKALKVSPGATPTKAQIEEYRDRRIKGQRYVYQENRVDKSDVSRRAKFEKGGVSSSTSSAVVVYDPTGANYTYFSKGGRVSKEQKTTLMKAAMFLAVYKNKFSEHQVGRTSIEAIISKFKTDPTDAGNINMAILNLENYKKDYVSDATTKKSISTVISELKGMIKGAHFAEGGSVSEDDAPKIFVADLAAYDEGKLIGEWLTLTDYSDGDEVMDAIQELLDQWSEEQGEKREEYAILDTENIPSGLYSESMDKHTFDKIIEAFNKAEKMNIPIAVLLEWISDTGGSFDSAEDAYQGQYDDEEDYAYQMVEEGVYTPSSHDVYVSETDKRIIAGEEADNRLEDMDEDELISQADMEDELNELKEKRDMIESLESDIEELESEIDDMDADDPDREEKEAELSEKQEELEKYASFDFDDEKTSLADSAKDKLYDDIYREWYDGLSSDPIYFLVEEQGLYSQEDALKADFIQVDYENVAKELGYDMHFIHHDGSVYVFSKNYSKGGSLGKPSNQVTLFEDGGVTSPAKENFKKEISLGKIDYYGSGRKINKVTIRVEIRNKENARDWETLNELHDVPEVAMSGNVWNGRGTDIITGGQILDDIARFYRGNAKVQRLIKIWEQYRLNDTKAGTKRQTEAIEAWEKDGNKYEYDAAVAHLKKIGLYEDNGYKYGHGWLYQPVPMSVIEEIKQLCADLETEKFADGGSVMGDSEISLINDVQEFAKGGTALVVPKKIVNSDAASYAENRMPFRGSNLEGKILDNGDYVVLSYGYYPIWYFNSREGKWYGTTDKFSNTTARQISQSRPDHQATLLPHTELLEKMKSDDARFDLGGIMYQQITSMPLDNTLAAHE